MGSDDKDRVRLPGVAWASLLCFWLPGTLVQLTLRALLYRDREALGLAIHGPRELFAGDLTFHAGMFCLTVALLGGLSHRRIVAPLAIALQLLGAFQIMFSLATAHFFRVTGTPLDFPLVVFGMGDLINNWELLHSEVSLWATPLGLGGAALLMWASRQITRRCPAQPLPARLARLWFAVAAALLAISATPSETSDVKLLRPPLWTLAFTVETLGSLDVRRAEAALVEELRADPARLASLGLRSGTAPRASLKAGDARRMNILVFIFESTGHFNTTLHDKSIDTTPTLAALARDRSIWAPRAYAVVPHTSKALVATFCGVEPHLTLPITEASDARDLRCLPNLLGERGWASASFQTSGVAFERWSHLVRNMGFDKIFSIDDVDATRWERPNYFGMDDRAMLEPVTRWALEQRAAGRPFIASVLTLAPHHDYKLPSSVRLRDYSRDELKNLHMNGIRYVDDMLADLIKEFKASGLYEETIFVILGDHGEAFGEHHRFQHDNVIYEEGLRIPMVIHDPRLEEAQVVEPRASQLDLMPTVLGLLGMTLEPDLTAGDDLRTLSRDRPIRAHCWFERYCMAHIEGDMKYIYHFGNRPEQVFDLSADPYEQHDVAAQHGALIEARRGALQAWRVWTNALWEQRLRESRTPTP
jgi:phosphoglycerol transferase MdoB-like AlkP superfamily enzyme